MSERVDCDRCEGNGHRDGERCLKCETLGTIELPDEDANELVTDRHRIIAEVTTWLRSTPRYDKDYPALLRAARRIEDWANT